MNLGIKFRLLALTVAVALMGVLIAVGTLSSQRQSAKVRARLGQVDEESFGIADHFRRSLRGLNNTMFDYGLRHDPADWDLFLKTSLDLDAWIDLQKPHLQTNPRERDLLQQIDRAFDDYTNTVRKLQAQVVAAGSQPTALADYAEFLAQSQRLFALGQALSDAHYARRNQLLADARQATARLHGFQLASLGMLFMTGLALAALVYRDMIAPLRLKLVESQALVERQEKLASLGMLAAGVAHEIRNPLTAIKAAAFIQQRKSPPASRDHADADLMMREILRLERIVNDFLQFARPGEPALTPLPAELPLREVQLLLEPSLSGLKIQLVLQPSPPMRIQADADQLKQVLINLVQNAADAIGREGTITLGVRAGRKRLAGRETEVAILEVADTGKGIPPDVEKRLFDPFFTTKDAGTGLGLSIAARIVQEHGGALQYQTRLNVGTTFGIVLPADWRVSTGAKILLIEDDRGITETLQRVLADEGHTVAVERRGDEGLARAVKDPFNVVLTDLRLPGLNGLELVRQLHAAQPRLPIILITAFGTTETAIEATKFGAYDYLLKPFDLPQLLDLVRRAATSNRLMAEPVEVGTTATARDALAGRSAAMQAIYKHIGRVASKPVNVLIRGETGTGKELIARALYQHSDRANAPFIAINCAAIPETLLESELFGHERGAFTGADARRIGRFEQADHGTLFLDEIGDLSLGTQAKLLRVLQEKCLQRLGGKETIPVDVRIVAATHRDLETGIREKQFREDLYYRLSVVVIALPPLRDRREDIPELIRYFLQRHGPDLGNPAPSIHPEALDFLQVQPWPGNVRELENVVRKAILLAQNYTIHLDHVRAVLNKPALAAERAAVPLGECVDELLAAARRGELADAHARLLDAAERELFKRAIHQAQGNQARAARWLGVSRLTMKAKLVQFGLHPSQDSEPAQ